MKYNKRFLYHATQAENLVDIILLGIKAYDGWVYLADEPDHAVRFLMFRNYKKIVSLAIDVEKLDLNKLHYSNDHNIDFFQCDAYRYEGNIPNDALIIENSKMYDLTGIFEREKEMD